MENNFGFVKMKKCGNWKIIDSETTIKELKMRKEKNNGKKKGEKKV